MLNLSSFSQNGYVVSQTDTTYCLSLNEIDSLNVLWLRYVSVTEELDVCVDALENRITGLERAVRERENTNRILMQQEVIRKEELKAAIAENTLTKQKLKERSRTINKLVYTVPVSFLLGFLTGIIN